MPCSRIFIADELSINQSYRLSVQASNHLLRVLRLKQNAELIVFNGKGGQYLARICGIHGKNRQKDRIAEVELIEFSSCNVESPLETLLVQGLSRGDRMDYSIQKSVELGVSGILPVVCERSQFSLNAEQQQKRERHWQQIAISACEQCGRNRIPEIMPVLSLQQWLDVSATSMRFVLTTDIAIGTTVHSLPEQKSVAVIIGPEGGLSRNEIKRALTVGCNPLNLGPRILRTETACVAALTVVQSWWGDM